MSCSRAVLGGAGLFLAVAACAGPSPAPIAESTEPERIPDPPPRYAHAELDSGIELPPEGEPQLHVRCDGHRPYVCPLDDGTFDCSETPCVPSCERVGCVGGDVCISCDGAFRCAAPGDGC